MNKRKTAYGFKDKEHLKRFLNGLTAAYSLYGLVDSSLVDTASEDAPVYVITIEEGVDYILSNVIDDNTELVTLEII